MVQAPWWFTMEPMVFVYIQLCGAQLPAPLYQTRHTNENSNIPLREFDPATLVPNLTRLSTKPPEQLNTSGSCLFVHLYFIVICNYVTESSQNTVEYLCCTSRYGIADNLFGTCQNILERQPVVQFHLTEEFKGMLEYSLQGLLKLDYGWSDDYTQCIIGGLLESYERSLTPDLIYCDSSEKQRLRLETSLHIDVCSEAMLEVLEVCCSV